MDVLFFLVYTTRARFCFQMGQEVAELPNPWPFMVIDGTELFLLNKLKTFRKSLGSAIDKLFSKILMSYLIKNYF